MVADIRALVPREPMTLDEFHNGLRILLNLERHMLVDAGILKRDDVNGWGTFVRDPFRFFIRADDRTAERLWLLMKMRMK